MLLIGIRDLVPLLLAYLLSLHCVTVMNVLKKWLDLGGKDVARLMELAAQPGAYVRAAVWCPFVMAITRHVVAGASQIPV